MNLADATIVENDEPQLWFYAWPAAGLEWAAGDAVEVQIYHRPDQEVASLPTIQRPARPPTVMLHPTGQGELTVSWEAPDNAAAARVTDYQVLLKREDAGWTDALRWEFTPSGQDGERLSVAFSGLAGGEEYRGAVYARNGVFPGLHRQSLPMAAPASPPAILNSLTMTGVTGLDFAPHENHYQGQMDSGVIETTIVVETMEETATTEVIGVRVNGGIVLDTEDADPDAPGHQVRVAGSGDTLVLVKVTSDDETREEMYGVILEQDSDDPPPANGGPNLYPLGLLLKQTSRQPAGDGSTDSVIIRPTLASLTVSPGTITPNFSADTRRYYVDVEHGVNRITVNAEMMGQEGKVNGRRITVPDADPNLPGYQVAVRSSHPGGEPAHTAFAIVLSTCDEGWYPCRSNWYRFVVRSAPPSQSDATLRSLELEDAELSRSFLYDLLDYSASASHDTATATIKLDTNQPDATVTYDPADADGVADGYQRTLVAGDNPVTITVTAPDGNATQDYTVTINRASPPSTDATLGSLAVAETDIAPAFSSSVDAYTATVRLPRRPAQPDSGDDRRRGDHCHQPRRRQSRGPRLADTAGGRFQHRNRHRHRRGREHHQSLHPDRQPELTDHGVGAAGEPVGGQCHTAPRLRFRRAGLHRRGRQRCRAGDPVRRS